MSKADSYVDGCDKAYRLPDYRVHGIRGEVGKTRIQAVIRNK